MNKSEFTEGLKKNIKKEKSIVYLNVLVTIRLVSLFNSIRPKNLFYCRAFHNVAHYIFL